MDLISDLNANLLTQIGSVQIEVDDVLIGHDMAIGMPRVEHDVVKLAARFLAGAPSVCFIYREMRGAFERL
jgi:hypothetical protein